jgi:hypothetical protein
MWVAAVPQKRDLRMAIGMIARMKAAQLLFASLVFCAGLAGAEAAFAPAKPGAMPGQSAGVTVPFVGCASGSRG